MTLASWLAERNVEMKEIGRCVKLVELQLCPSVGYLLV